MSEVKTGLVMEGGAMRGMFTAGVLDIFMENDVTFDGAIGVSAGVAFGCNIKSKQIGRVIRYNKRFCRNPHYRSYASLIFTGDLFNAKFCYDTIPNKLDLFDYETFINNPMKFFLVASDCKNAVPIYRELKTCDKNEMLWMRASASMPLVSRVVKVDGYELLDGAITDSIPLEHFQSIGYNRNIVVLTRPREFVKKQESAIGLIRFALRKYPKLLKKMENRHNFYNEQKKYVFEQADSGQILAVYPKKELPISRADNNPEHLQLCYEEGRKACLENLEKVKEFLKK